jgi:hypothetical protein
MEQEPHVLPISVPQTIDRSHLRLKMPGTVFANKLA